MGGTALLFTTGIVGTLETSTGTAVPVLFDTIPECLLVSISEGLNI